MIKLAKDRFKQLHNVRLFCEICSFDFHKAYGDLGKASIEGHHIVPVSEPKESLGTQAEDIVYGIC
ncbi:putative HNH restriction endonuclease [Bacillus thuringiensis]